MNDKPRLSLDEINQIVSDIARDPDAGADRFRALKMLASSDSASVVLPEPLGDDEIVERLARLMKGAGLTMTQLGYARAFPQARASKFGGSRLKYPDATDGMIEEAKRITSLPLLFRRFPHTKINGVPKGFPSGRSTGEKITWCRREALKMLVEEQNATKQEAHVGLKAESDGNQDSPTL